MNRKIVALTLLGLATLMADSFQASAAARSGRASTKACPACSATLCQRVCGIDPSPVCIVDPNTGCRICACLQ